MTISISRAKPKSFIPGGGAHLQSLTDVSPSTLDALVLPNLIVETSSVFDVALVVSFVASSQRIPVSHVHCRIAVLILCIALILLAILGWGIIL